MTMGKDQKNSDHESDEENDATAAAKEKFLGALSEMFDESSDSEVETKKPRRKRLLGRRGRQKSRITVTDATPAAFVMKLFDRSVDLTQFGPHTPLYPICRAWFQNNPKELFKRPTYKKKEDKLSPRDVTFVPVPSEEDDGPISPPRSTFKPENDVSTLLKGDNQNKNELLADNRRRWLLARSKAKQNYQKRCDRYAESFQLLRRVRQEAFAMDEAVTSIK